MDKSNKLAGGITTILIVALLLFIAMKNTDHFEGITDKVSNIFEPNRNLVTVEAFGNEHQPEPNNQQGPMGYWDHSQNRYTQVHSSGPPVGGTQSASYQMYQQAVNAATPTVSQLENISNLPSYAQGPATGPNAGVGNSFRPGIVPPAGGYFDAAAVDFGNRRASLISPCAQNAPTFVSSSLLPKTNLPGVPSWNVVDTQALAHQDFLSPTQQFGTDTVMSSLRNSSYDIRGTIVNPVTVVSPWLNSTIDPDLMRKPLECHNPEGGVYGCSPASYSGKSIM